MKSIVLAGSRGIGKAICNELQNISDELISTSTKNLDTSNLEDVKSFISQHPTTDVLVLNTGGPPAKSFWDIEEAEWQKYFTQLFLSFALILQKIKINPNGFVFLISSFYIKEPDPKMILSNSFRIGFTSIFKAVSKLYLDQNVSFINIAPGPTDTERLRDLAKQQGRSFEEFVDSFPTKRVSHPSEIGKFVRLVVENKIHAMSGVSINFDMGLSNYVL